MILCDPTAYTVGGILQARTLECVAFPFFRGSSQPRSSPLQVDSLPAETQGKPKNIEVGSLSLLQWIFPTQESNWGLWPGSSLIAMSYHTHSTSRVVPVVKNPPTSAEGRRDVGSLPRSGRSPREGNGNPLQYSCLENHMDRGA